MTNGMKVTTNKAGNTVKLDNDKDGNRRAREYDKKENPLKQTIYFKNGSGSETTIPRKATFLEWLHDVGNKKADDFCHFKTATLRNSKGKVTSVFDYDKSTVIQYD